MKYKDYRVVDFIKDDFFVEWVKNPNAQSNNFWQEYTNSNPEQIRQIQEAKGFINSIEYDDYEPLSSNEYIELFENILKPVNRNENPLGRKFVRSALKVAAAVTVLFTIAFLYKASESDKKPIQEQASFNSIKQNPRGQKSISILPDGTKINLNAESTLIVDSLFGVNERKVFLKGEAFFDVVPDQSRPFIITTGKVETKVLGTSFNVRSFEDETNIEILVVSGEVSVSDLSGNSVYLNVNDLLEYDQASRNIKITNQKDLSPYLGWKEGILVFDDDKYDQVVEKIEKWYNVRIVSEENFRLSGRYTAKYDNTTLKKVMDGWSYSSGFSYTISTDNTIKINKP